MEPDAYGRGFSLSEAVESERRTVKTLIREDKLKQVFKSFPGKM